LNSFDFSLSSFKTRMFFFFKTASFGPYTSILNRIRKPVEKERNLWGPQVCVPTGGSFGHSH
jgi:hypothetical protein